MISRTSSQEMKKKKNNTPTNSNYLCKLQAMTRNKIEDIPYQTYRKNKKDPIQSARILTQRNKSNQSKDKSTSQKIIKTQQTKRESAQDDLFHQVDAIFTELEDYMVQVRQESIERVKELKNNGNLSLVQNEIDSMQSMVRYIKQVVNEFVTYKDENPSSDSIEARMSQIMIKDDQQMVEYLSKISKKQ